MYHNGICKKQRSVNLTAIWIDCWMFGFCIIYGYKHWVIVLKMTCQFVPYRGPITVPRYRQSIQLLVWSASPEAEADMGQMWTESGKGNYRNDMGLPKDISVGVSLFCGWGWEKSHLSIGWSDTWGWKFDNWSIGCHYSWYHWCIWEIGNCSSMHNCWEIYYWFLGWSAWCYIPVGVGVNKAVGWLVAMS